MALTIGESATAGYLGFLNPITATAYTAPQTLVTCNASEDKECSHIIFFNFHTVAVTVCIYYLPNNGGAVRVPASEDSYKIAEHSIGINKSWTWDIPTYLAATNDTIGVYASVTAVVNALAMGYEKT
jgi:hypothetical protein